MEKEHLKDMHAYILNRMTHEEHDYTGCNYTDCNGITFCWDTWENYIEITNADDGSWDCIASINYTDTFKASDLEKLLEKYKEQEK